MTNEPTTLTRYTILSKNERHENAISHTLTLDPPSERRMQELHKGLPGHYRIVRLTITVEPYVDDRWQELVHFDHDMWAEENRTMVPNLSSADMADWAAMLRRTIDKAVELGIVTKVGCQP